MSGSRIRFSPKSRNEIWERWKAGNTFDEIATALGVSRPTITNRIREHGGVTPAPRRRRADSLTIHEREEIMMGIARERTLREIAMRIGRAPSTVCREINRHGGRRHYRAAVADQQAWENAKRPQSCKLATNRPLREHVAKKLSEDWSPQQIAGWLKDEFGDDQTMRVSHETIYQTLFIQARGALKRELTAYLRSKRQMRRPQKAGATTGSNGPIVDPVSIRQRPAEAEDRAIPGHWEGDLIVGSKNTHIATLVERHSRFVMLVKVDGCDTQTVTDALARHVVDLPRELKRSLTWDRGAEMANHKEFTIATDVQVYFCDPQSPWQRGSNENTNGLLRQYFPKGTDLSVHSQEHLDMIANKLNTRPRKTLEFKTPAYKLEAALR